MKLKVSKFKNTTFAIQIIQKQPPGVPQKNPLSKILQYLQENTSAGVSPQ